MPLEIERKFLLKNTDIPDADEKFHILQDYLIPKDPNVSSERVRMIQEWSNWNYAPTNVIGYFHTVKTHIGKGTCEEIENEIDVNHYYELIRRRDPKSTCISKQRNIYHYNGHKFEVDRFNWPKRFLMVEVELSDINEEIDFPEWMIIDREVTDDPAYSNHNIAKREQECLKNIHNADGSKSLTLLFVGLKRVIAKVKKRLSAFIWRTF